MTERMPLNVKIFLWLTIVAICYWAGTAIWFRLHPSDTVAMAKMLAEMRPDSRQTAIEANRISVNFGLGVALVWSTVTLSLAWVAAFYRRNWARWAYAILFLVRESLPFGAALALHRFHIYLAQYLSRGWGEPRAYILPVLFTLAIIFVFTGKANAWFRPTPQST